MSRPSQTRIASAPSVRSTGGQPIDANVRATAAVRVIGGRRVAWFGLGGHEHGVYGSRRESLAGANDSAGVRSRDARQEL